MGNTNTKTHGQDEVYLNGLSKGMDSLRKSVDLYPNGTKKFKFVLDSNEKKVQDVLRRSRKGSTRKKALDVLRDLEDLREKERTSIRDSSLDNGAVESNSIIAADAKKYDKSLQHSRSVEDLQNIRKKVDHLSDRISTAGTREDAAASRQEIEVLKTQLDRLHVRPNSKLETYKEEYKNKLRRYEQKLAAKEPSLATTDGGALSKLPCTQQQDKVIQSDLNTQDELAMVRGQVLSLQTECEKFQGYKDTPEYNKLAQELMKLWDKLGKIKDCKLEVERDSVIGLISLTLKQLNRKCVDNTRCSLSNNKILGLTELFHMQYKKIAIQMKQGRVKEGEQVYRILKDVHNGLGVILDQDQNGCQLVTARMTPSLKRKPVPIYVSSRQLMGTNFDTVYVDNEDQPRVLKSNTSCPNFAGILGPQEQQVHAMYVANVAEVANLPMQTQDNWEPKDSNAEKRLGILNNECNMLKYAVDQFQGFNDEKYNELDERLIDMLIQLEGIKGKLNGPSAEQWKTIWQRVQNTCGNLKEKYNKPRAAHVRSSAGLEQLQEIDKTLANLEILKTQINESYDWQTDNPEFKVLNDALKSALLRLDLIEPGGDPLVHTTREDAISDVRESIKRLNERRYIENRYAGTEV